MSPSPPVVSRAERIGRRLVLAVFGAAVAGFTLHNTVRIIDQVFFVPVPAAKISCRDGVLQLVTGIRQARRAAAAEEQGERASMATYRSTLEPIWAVRASLDRACYADPEGLRALTDVDRLRYAEEHAVRSDAVDLARLRRRVHTLEKEFGGAPPP